MPCKRLLSYVGMKLMSSQVIEALDINSSQSCRAESVLSKTQQA